MAKRLSEMTASFVLTNAFCYLCQKHMSMPFLPAEKLFSRSWFVSYALILCGTFILAAGFVLFITPHRIVPGGVYGIAIVIHYLTQGMFSFAPNGLPVGTVAVSLDIPLILIGIKILGPRFGIKTIIGSALTAFWVDFLTSLYGYEPLVPDDTLLSSVFGGVLLGVGLGLIFKSKATSGGSDIIAMIAAKYTRMPVGQLLIIVDSLIVLFGLVAFRDWRIPLYSWVVIFITGRVIDYLLEGAVYHKSLFIISDKYEEIGQKLLYDLGRGGTLLAATGMYEGKERKIIFTNVNRREMILLRSYIHSIDPNAFITVFDASEVLGEGFKPLKD